MPLERDRGPGHHHAGAFISAHRIERYGSWRCHDPLGPPLAACQAWLVALAPTLTTAPPKPTDHSRLRPRDKQILGRLERQKSTFTSASGGAAQSVFRLEI